MARVAGVAALLLTYIADTALPYCHLALLLHLNKQLLHVRKTTGHSGHTDVNLNIYFPKCVCLLGLCVQ